MLKLRFSARGGGGGGGGDGAAEIEKGTGDDMVGPAGSKGRIGAFGRTDSLGGAGAAGRL